MTRANAFILACSLSLSGPLFADEMMVERMQSVVDEVSELRSRYESSVRKNQECLQQIEEQNEEIKKLSSEKTSKSKRETELENKLERLQNENIRLSSSVKTLNEKKQSLLAEIEALKNEIKKSANPALAKENKRLLEELAVSQKNLAFLENEISSGKEEPLKQAKTSCPEENPFPKLLMKDEKKIRPHTVEKETAVQVVESEKPVQAKEKELLLEAPLSTTGRLGFCITKAGTYRTKYESVIYDSPQGKAICIWEEKRSFTSNIIRGEWIKITGYFIEQKWQKASEEMWIREKDTLRR